MEIRLVFLEKVEFVSVYEIFEGLIVLINTLFVFKVEPFVYFDISVFTEIFPGPSWPA